MRNYIQSFMTTIESGASGWPTGLTDDDRAWLTARVRVILSNHIHLHLMQIVDFVLYSRKKSYGGFELSEDSILHRVALLDYIHGSVFRALLAANCEPVWVLKPPGTVNSFHRGESKRD